VYTKYLSISHVKYVNSKGKCTVLPYYYRLSSADIVSHPSCVEEGSSTSEASTDTTVGPTTGDTDEGEHSEYQEEGMKGTRESETESSPKKGMYDLLP